MGGGAWPFLVGGAICLVNSDRWGNSGNSITHFLVGGSKITADGDFSHEIKRCLLLAIW